MDSIATSLARMNRLNPSLSAELSKLPEIRRLNSDDPSAALNTLLEIYHCSPDRFDRLFQHMDSFGLSGSRCFCAPLQAMFWLCQDGKTSAADALLGLDDIRIDGQGLGLGQAQNRADTGKALAGSDPQTLLKQILDRAWGGEYRSLMTATLHEIIAKITAIETAREYAILLTRHSHLQIQGYIIDDFLIKKEIFDAGDWETIEKAVALSRWKSFYTVADRLNAPELISYYMDRYFFFRKTPASGVYMTFFNKRAQCTDAAYFAQFMLNRSGYTTFIRSVKWDNDPWDGLHTGAGIVLDDGQFLLVSNFTGINAMSGPFPDTQSLDEKLSCGRKIIDSQWGAYYPPRYY